MSKKVMLTTRLEPELIARLSEKATALFLPVDATISAALDALEREQNIKASITERVENLEATLGRLVDLLSEQLTEQRAYQERDNERMKFVVDKVLKSLYQANLVHQFQLHIDSAEHREIWLKHAAENITPMLSRIQIPE